MAFLTRSLPRRTVLRGMGATLALPFLDETPQWLQKYQPGKIRTKRVKMFVDMKGLTPEPA